VIDWPLQAQRGLADGHEMYVHGDRSLFLPRVPFPTYDRGMMIDGIRNPRLDDYAAARTPGRIAT
jgi:hypothetical protein